MLTKTIIDKSSWPLGTWQDESDVYIWQDKHTKYKCMIIRNTDRGYLSGYIIIPKNSYILKRCKIHNFDIITITELMGIHNYVDFSIDSKTMNSYGGYGGCHTESLSDNECFIGFHCKGYTDLAPNFQYPSDSKRVYRSVEFVQGICKSLAFQIKYYRLFRYYYWFRLVIRKIKNLQSITKIVV